MPVQSASSPQPDLLHAVAERLAPLFFEDCHSREIARMRATEVIEGYGPQSAEEYGTIGCILAYSLSALYALGRAAEKNIEVDDQLRYYDVAIRMNDAALRHEAALAKVREARSRGQLTQTAVDPQAVVAAVDKAMGDYNTLQFPLRDRSRRPRGRGAAPQPPRPAATPLGDRTLC
ncbi:MAG TPA: hypothetical protein VE690_20840 [Rhodopila sp.]|nr:hypothetical protein [Rhodopila sp.]